MAPLVPGSTLGPYQIIQQIGLGGMATVYKAFQPAMQRYVALKVLPDHFAQNPEFVARFIREARTIAGLEHKSILPVYDFGEQDGVTYLAMRFLEGGTLKDLAQKVHLSLPDVVDLLSQVASALDYAHRRGVIHRDIKPANIMIDGEGAAYLTDFGIAKVLESAEGLTATGATIGTPAYMAPEQSLGQKVDHRADIYALGIILYELMVGRPPYQADTPMAVALAHIHNPLPIPSAVNPDVPFEIEEVILKALAKNPDDRYDSANAFAAALRQAAQATGVDLSQRHLASLVSPDFTRRNIAADTSPAITAAQTPQSAPAPTPSTLIEPTPGAPPARVAAPPPPPVAPPAPAKKTGLPLALLGLGGAAALLVIGALIVAGFVFLPSLLNPGGAVETGSYPAEFVYDDFEYDDPEAPPDPDRWNVYFDTPGCLIYRYYGELFFSNDRSPDGLGCTLVFTDPETIPGNQLGDIAADFQVEPDGVPGYYGTLLRYITWFPDGEYVVECGLTGNYPETNIALSIYDTRIADDWPEIGVFYSEFPIESYSYATVRLTVDPATMTFACLHYDTEIASFTPENAAELQRQLFERQVGNWRDPNAQVTVRAQLMYAFPVDQPAELLPLPEGDDTPTGDPLYDNFEDPAFNGSLNPDRWDIIQYPLPCNANQSDGVLAITNDPTINSEPGCEIVPTAPRDVPGDRLELLQADLNLTDLDGPYAGSTLRIDTPSPDADNETFFVDCGLYYGEGETFAIFNVTNTALSTEPIINEGRPVDPDLWYTFALVIDPTNMVFTCLLDGEPIGEYVTGGLGPALRDQSWQRRIVNWRGPETTATTLIDNVYLIPGN